MLGYINQKISREDTYIREEIRAEIIAFTDLILKREKALLCHPADPIHTVYKPESKRRAFYH